MGLKVVVYDPPVVGFPFLVVAFNDQDMSVLDSEPFATADEAEGYIRFMAAKLSIDKANVNYKLTR